MVERCGFMDRGVKLLLLPQGNCAMRTLELSLHTAQMGLQLLNWFGARRHCASSTISMGRLRLRGSAQAKPFRTFIRTVCANSI